MTSPDWTATETPPNWDYTASLSTPSRSGCASNEGVLYQVGPTRSTYKSPKDVPWLKLVACDRVQIDYSATPYKDVIFIGARGAANKYITIEGMPGPNGERPIFDGNGATTASTMAMGSVYDGEGMIVVGKPNLSARTYGYKPGYLHITGLHIRNVRSAYTHGNLSGSTVSWPDFTAAINVNPAEHIAITNCELENSGLGLFVNSLNAEAGQTRWLLVKGNYFHGNGMVNHAELHNSYTEAVGTIYEGNYFGQPISGTMGDNVKERSAGIVFRNNYLEGGVYGLSLRDPQSNGPFEATQVDSKGDLLTKHAFVYNNIFNLRGSSQVVVGHGDGSFGDGGQYRFGNLFFYSNKVVSQLDYVIYDRDVMPLFEMLNTKSLTTVSALNNLFYTKAGTSTGKPTPFAIFEWQGIANFQGNWINSFQNTNPNWGNRNTGVFVGTKYDGSGLNGLTASSSSPGFTDLAGGDFTALSGSAFTTLGASLPSAVIQRNLLPTGSPVQFPQLTSQP